jgi:predicted dehydrogenase
MQGEVQHRMADGKVRIGVIGVGRWANSIHVPQILSHPGAELVALCARTDSKVRAAGDQFGVKRVYTDAVQMLDDGDLDAVTISTTHNAHYSVAMAALERGLHVFCEKPLGLNSRETGEMAQAARERGLKTMVAFTNRWVPEAMYARQLIAEGYVGEGFHYNVCQLASYGRPGGSWMWRSDPALSGGGVLFDLGCHNIDLAQWLMGPISRVSATLRNTSAERPRDGQMLPTPSDDTDAFVAEFANGCQGIFHISWTSPGDRVMRHEIAGRDGLLALSLYHDEWVNSLSGCRAGQAEREALAVPDAVQGAIPRVAGADGREAAHRAFLLQSPSLVRGFIDTIVGDTDPSPSFDDGHLTQRVMDAVVTSAQERCWMDV